MKKFAFVPGLLSIMALASAGQGQAKQGQAKQEKSAIPGQFSTCVHLHNAPAVGRPAARGSNDGS